MFVLRIEVQLYFHLFGTFRRAFRLYCIFTWKRVLELEVYGFFVFIEWCGVTFCLQGFIASFVWLWIANSRLKPSAKGSSLLILIVFPCNGFLREPLILRCIQTLFPYHWQNSHSRHMISPCSSSCIDWKHGAQLSVEKSIGCVRGSDRLIDLHALIPGIWF